MSGDRFLRPETSVLGESSVIPPENQIRPAPNRFTHRLETAEPFNFRDDSEAPDGTLEAGTEVVVLRRDGDRCRVADRRGLYVVVRWAALRALDA